MQRAQEGDRAELDRPLQDGGSRWGTVAGERPTARRTRPRARSDPKPTVTASNATC